MPHGLRDVLAPDPRESEPTGHSAGNVVRHQAARGPNWRPRSEMVSLKGRDSPFDSPTGFSAAGLSPLSTSFFVMCPQPPTNHEVTRA